MGYFIGVIVYGLIFGAITKYVAQSKGYDGGFWWGFFLGVIGLLVVGFKPDLNQQTSYSTTQQTVHNYSSTSQDKNEEKTEQHALKAEKQWLCISCLANNPEKAKFCFQCGEPRHYDWKCSMCGEVNTAKTKFCCNCGKKKDLSEELDPSSTISEKLTSIPSETLQKLEECSSAKSMLSLIKSIENLDYDNEQIKGLLEKLESLANFERMYGSMKYDAIRYIKQYEG